MGVARLRTSPRSTIMLYMCRISDLRGMFALFARLCTRRSLFSVFSNSLGVVDMNAKSK